MAQTIQIRRDTAANWTTANPILAQGEIGYETDTGNFKIGNGVTSWSSLSYSVLQGQMPARINDFRLSLTTGIPVTTSDVTAATTIYCVPCTGNQIALYNGSAWFNYTSAEFSLGLGTLTSAKPYDVFCYQNAGVPTLEFLAWTNDTTRATALAYNSGILIKSGDATRRYLGTFYTTSTTTTEDSIANRYLWNYYHRVSRKMQVLEATASWTYTTATLRQANGSTANQLNFVCGVAEDDITATLSVRASNTSAGVVLTSGIGLDSTTATLDTYANAVTAVAGGSQMFVSSVEVSPQLGRHYLSWLELSQATGTTTWSGSSVWGIKGRIMT